MGWAKELLLDEEYAERAAWEVSPAGWESAARVRREATARNADEAAAVSLRDKEWSTEWSGEWDEWERVRLLLVTQISFGGPDYDFDAFRNEVGRQPSARHIVSRMREYEHYQTGNLRWVENRADAPASPHMTAREAAEYLRMAYSTFRGHARFIKRAPQTKTYLREDLDEYANKQKCRRVR